MIVQLRLFAAARQAVGAPTISLALERPATVADLRRSLVRRYPALATWEPHLLFAVNEQFAADDHPLQEGVEIACFPPVSGG